MARILIAEDSATQRHALTTLLESLGHDVVAASDGEEALASLHRDRFDLVISDVIMPGMDGYELCREIKTSPDVAYRPPVLLLTGMGDPRDMMRGLEAGADNYITKPYKPEQLAQRIDSALRGAGPRAAEDGRSVTFEFMADHFTVPADPARILRLLLSSFEDLINVNLELEASKREVAAAHMRELEREQRAREEAEATAQRLEELRARAEAATQARDDVMAAVSHDLRNPVSTIYTAASLLLDMELPPHTQTRQLEIIRRTAQRMDRLIQDLLDVTRIDNGALAITKGIESLQSLMQEVFEQFQNVAAAANVTLVVDRDVPDVSMVLDRGRILQVFSNLIGNAIKFTPAQGTVTVKAVIEEGTVLFSVRDSGSGIPSESLTRIFERFWQGGEKREAGAGLGLAIAKGIVEGHAGRIWAASEPGSGAEFFFRIPMR